MKVPTLGVIYLIDGVICAVLGILKQNLRLLVPLGMVMVT